MKFAVVFLLAGFVCASVNTKALADVGVNFFKQPEKREVPISDKFHPHRYPRVYLKSEPMSEEEAYDLINRVTRAAAARKDQEPQDAPARPPKPCKYKKGAWSACDSTSNLRTRTDTLRKGDSSCESAKIRKKDCRANKKGKQRNNAKGRANKLKVE